MIDPNFKTFYSSQQVIQFQTSFLFFIKLINHIKVAKYVYTNLVPTRTNGIIYELMDSLSSSGQISYVYFLCEKIGGQVWFSNRIICWKDRFYVFPLFKTFTYFLNIVQPFSGWHQVFHPVPILIEWGYHHSKELLNIHFQIFGENCCMVYSQNQIDLSEFHKLFKTCTASNWTISISLISHLCFCCCLGTFK